MDTEALAPTTSLYNLGSSTYKWNKLYCNNINVYNAINLSGSATALQLVTQVTLTTTASAVTISGLGKNNRNDYTLICMFKGQADTDTAYGMRIVATTVGTVSGYKMQYCLFSQTGAYYVQTSVTQVPIGVTLNDDTTASCYAYSICQMNLSGNTKLFTVKNVNSANGAFVRNTEFIGCSCGITLASTITSIDIIGANMQAGTIIQLWSKQGEYV
jgi:hypothetical protein